MQKTERVVFADPAPQKQEKKEKTDVDWPWRFLLFPLPDHVYINYAASEACTVKKGNGRLFYADEKQFGMWREEEEEEEEGPGVFEADKNGNVPLLLNTPVSKLLVGVWGDFKGWWWWWWWGGRKAEERVKAGGGGGWGRHPSCV